MSKIEDYVGLFRELLLNKTTIYNKKGTESITLSDEINWVQCYMMEDQIRNKYPKYWFVSEKGDVISLKSNPILLNKTIKTGSGYVEYQYTYKDIYGNSKKKHIKASILMSQCFEVLHYGKAHEVMKVQGEYAYKNGLLNTHHIQNNKKDNSVDNLEILTTQVHRAISGKRMNTTKSMIQLARVASEEPSSITILHTNESIDSHERKNISRAVYATDRIKISVQAYEQLKQIGTDITAAIVLKNAINGLNNQFFIEPRFFMNTDTYACFCVFLDDNKKRVEPIKDMNEIVGKPIIPYDNSGNCFIDNSEQIVTDL